ncbi:4a-hydroxytetrahydrobiopterin dehydratase [Sulfuracidifex tepidarius]|uniref:Putative pterin-4-alpha-carbinolamine dehydratase n=1 Tax=Sulfuracidifex tepidarius TaxID=1294262 RepID=A0A510DZC5_9CREN|nr:4a-hydroxytetrahydrobiopterin dehydratase [Sulfuracidifex tepidarius]BBG22720.1 Putative pterin-4-alpha-carbinolamine dehydratase [Sulfuracidifex tepidarius]BBG25499.1 Putative pterin-4-alpha-carbinolamine dehydratase [Sulfuracidifex tepidarius]
MAKLSEQEIKEMVRQLPEGWEVRDQKLRKEFIFNDFKGSVDFLKRIQPVADSMNHHPDVCIYYSKVIIELTTHDEGGITKMDFDLAMKIDSLSKVS